MPNFWQDRRVFVTGCTGLVGSWTVRALSRSGNGQADVAVQGPGLYTTEVPVG